MDSSLNRWVQRVTAAAVLALAAVLLAVGFAYYGPRSVTSRAHTTEVR